MSTEADVTFFVEEAGMVTMVDHVGIAFRSLGTYRMTLTCLAYICVDNNLAVDRNGDMVAYSLDFLGVPLFDGTEVEMLGTYDSID